MLVHPLGDRGDASVLLPHNIPFFSTGAAISFLTVSSDLFLQLCDDGGNAGDGLGLLSHKPPPNLGCGVTS